MEQSGPERRLAAILAADVVGYSRLMAQDEAGTHARLKTLRKSLVEPVVEAHRGRIVKLMGDGALVEFSSVADAVACAREIQEGVPERQVGVDQLERIHFRIGIHLGDILIDEGDIYGDGVNVAARLEGLAEPDGICISDPVRQSLLPEAACGFESLGEQRLKNIARPLRVWRWNGGRSPTAAQGPTLPGLQPVMDKPSIVVLPFDDLSGDPDQAYFSDGITEDVITDLSQISGLLVIARNSAFQYKGRAVGHQQIRRELGVRYMLEGSVRRLANRVRVNAQLIDTHTGFHLWAERFDRDLEDVFALQDEITHAIVRALEVKLTQREHHGIARRYTSNLAAYDLFLRARASQLERTERGLKQARKFLKRALELDPDFAAAYALLADNYRQEWLFEWRDEPDVLDRALELAQTAVRIDGELPLAHAYLGWIHLWRKEHEPAIEEARLGILLDPNDAEGHARLGHILDFADRPEEAVPMIERAMRLDPHFPFLFSFFLGHAYQAMGRLPEAVEAFRHSIVRSPEHIGSRQMLAAAFARLERADEARAETEEVLRLSPSFSIARFVARMPLASPERARELTEALRKAGLPM